MTHPERFNAFKTALDEYAETCRQEHVAAMSRYDAHVAALDAQAAEARQRGDDTITFEIHSGETT